MEKDCLHKIMIKNVSNNSLPRLGCVKFVLAPQEGHTLTPYIDMSGMTRAFIVGNAIFTNAEGTADFGQEAPYYQFFIKNITEGDILFVELKYDLTLIKFNEDNNNAFKCLKDNSTLDLYYCNLLQELSISKHITAVNCDLNELTKANGVLTKVRWHYNTLLTGDIETIVTNLIANGRTSGALIISANSSNIRLNGSTFMTGNKDSQYIKFNSANDVTVNYGDTYDVSKIEASWDGSTWSYETT